MKYAITLGFDDKTEHALDCMRRMLKENGIVDEAAEMNHITLYSVETQADDGLQKILMTAKDVAETFERFEVELYNVGFFLGEKNVVFVSPVMTETLCSLHKLVDKKFSNYKHKNYYNPNKWVPHATLLAGIGDGDLVEAIKVLKSTDYLPLDAVADKIVVIGYDEKTYEQIASFELAKQVF